MRRALLGLLLVSAAAVSAQGTEGDVPLKDGPGKDKVVANCGLCHSLDYVRMNSVFLDRKGWEASVNKMVKVMGAPIQERDIPAIVDYLTTQYGL